MQEQEELIKKNCEENTALERTRRQKILEQKEQVLDHKQHQILLNTALTGLDDEWYSNTAAQGQIITSTTIPTTGPKNIIAESDKQAKEIRLPLSEANHIKGVKLTSNKN